jgi:ABC-type sugar transport system ATPase subunit
VISLHRISISAGAFALHDVSFAVPAGAYGVLMGPTGSGKTTLIEIVCGLRKPDSGRVVISESDVTALSPGNRGVGYVPQDGALFPTLTVRQQLAFALKVRRRPRQEIDGRVMELAEHLGVAHLLDRKPAGLSGGERQRIALGRALAARPGVLLLDEPLSALDEPTRAGLRDLLKSIQREHAVSVLHVTHDRAEAAALADVVFQLNGGQVEPEKIATP